MGQKCVYVGVRVLRVWCWSAASGTGPSLGGRTELLQGRLSMWEPLSLVFVYGAQPSYLQPVLTPHSSCSKSLLLIFLFSPATVAAWLDGFLVVSLFFLHIICVPVCVLFFISVQHTESASELRGKMLTVTQECAPLKIYSGLRCQAGNSNICLTWEFA